MSPNKALENERANKPFGGLTRSLKIAASFGAITLIACALGWHLSPYLTLHKMKQAIEQENASEFNSAVDYPKLRISLKAELSKKLQLDKPSDSTAQAMNGNGNAFALVLANALVDRFVQPEVMSQTIKNGKAKVMLQKLRQVSNPESKEQQWDVQRQGISQFVLWNAPQKQATIGLVFQRNPWGIDWKLSAIVATPRALSEHANSIGRNQ